MSRSGYSEDCEYLELYRANVDRSIGGKRGQAFLREMIESLDAMPQRELAEVIFVDEDSGECCALGAVALSRGVENPGRLNYEDPQEAGYVLGIPWMIACEVAHENDDGALGPETPSERWVRMRVWAQEHLK